MTKLSQSTVLAILVLTFGCGDNVGGASDPGANLGIDDGPAVIDVPSGATSVTAMVSAGDGAVLTIDAGPLAGLRFTIPPGALAEDTEITLAPGGPSQLGHELSLGTNPGVGQPALEMLLRMVGGWEDLSHYGVMLSLEQLNHDGIMPAGTVLDMQPEGLQFLLPATVEFPYAEMMTGDDPVDDVSARWLALMHVSQGADPELLLPVAFDSATRTVSFEIHHFSKVGWGRFFEALGRVFLSRGAVSPSDALTLGEGVYAIGEGTYEGVMRTIDTTSGALEAYLEADETETLATNMAADILCSGNALDTATPATGLTNLISALTMITTDANIISQQTGHELGYLDAMLAAEGQVTFDESLQMALDLAGGNVYDAFMTIHNVGQSISYGTWDTVSAWGGDPHETFPKLREQLLPKMAPLTGIDERITDTRGAWYHLAGLTAFSMRSGKGLPVAMATFDEVAKSGLMGGHFSVGDQLANMVGSSLGDILVEFAESSDEMNLCDELVVAIDSPADGSKIAEEDTSVTVTGTVNVATVEFVTVEYAGESTNVFVNDGAFSVDFDLVDDTAHTFAVRAEAVGGRSGSDSTTVSEAGAVALVVTPASGYSGSGSVYETKEASSLQGTSSTAMMLRVALSAAPDEPVTVYIRGVDAAEGTLTYPSAYTPYHVFTADNWSQSKAVRIRGKNDDVYDSDVSYEVRLVVEEGLYAGLEETFTVTNENADLEVGEWCENISDCYRYEDVEYVANAMYEQDWDDVVNITCDYETINVYLNFETDDHIQYIGQVSCYWNYDPTQTTTTSRAYSFRKDYYIVE